MAVPPEVQSFYKALLFKMLDPDVGLMTVERVNNCPSKGADWFESSSYRSFAFNSPLPAEFARRPIRRMGSTSL